jgi:hypothetical protein
MDATPSQTSNAAQGRFVVCVSLIALEIAFWAVMDKFANGVGAENFLDDPPHISSTTRTRFPTSSVIV